MIVKTVKPVCMVFTPCDNKKIVRKVFPMLKVGNEKLQYVESYQCLGRRIDVSNTEDDD